MPNPDAPSSEKADRTALDFEVTLQTLNYATRLLASELDPVRLVDRALDILMDFGRGKRAAMFSLADEGRALEIMGRTDGHPRLIPVAGTPLETILQTKLPRCYPSLSDEAIPLPAAQETDSGLECLCLPLIGSDHHAIGLVTLERPADDPLPEPKLQALNVLRTLIAVSFENARLFKLATVDGLTGLYVRRYFEIRLQEEATRVKRYGGHLALLITDIDHFKNLNDTYGHQKGDLALALCAKLLRGSLRRDIDVPCRYGGEEFVTILPATDLDGAARIAERVRQGCEHHPFLGEEKQVKVTLSGGVAVMNGTQPITATELLRRADAMLYEAKRSGRNRICVWRDGTGRTDP